MPRFEAGTKRGDPPMPIVQPDHSLKLSVSEDGGYPHEYISHQFHLRGHQRARFHIQFPLPGILGDCSPVEPLSVSTDFIRQMGERR